MSSQVLHKSKPGRHNRYANQSILLRELKEQRENRPLVTSRVQSGKKTPNHREENVTLSIITPSDDITKIAAFRKKPSTLKPPITPLTRPLHYRPISVDTSVPDWEIYVTSLEHARTDLEKRVPGAIARLASQKIKDPNRCHRTVDKLVQRHYPMLGPAFSRDPEWVVEGLTKDLKQSNNIEEFRIDVNDGEAYPKASFVEEYGGTTEWDKATISRPSTIITPRPYTAVAEHTSPTIPEFEEGISEEQQIALATTRSLEEAKSRVRATPLAEHSVSDYVLEDHELQLVLAISEYQF